MKRRSSNGAVFTRAGARMVAAVAVAVSALVLASVTGAIDLRAALPAILEPTPERADDLRVLAEDLPRRHLDLFHTVSRGVYEGSIRELRARQAELSDAEFELELRKIVAQVGEAHTSIGLPLERLYPFGLYDFDEGLRLTGAMPEHAHLLGARLIAIEGVAVQELRALITPLIPSTNASHLRFMLPMYLISPRILTGLGLGSKGGPLQFAFQTDDGAREVATAAAVERDRVAAFERLFVDGGSPAAELLYFTRYDENYWATYDAAREIAYFQYNRCRELPDRPVSEVVRRWKAELAGRPVRAIVVDLRRNGGGDSRVLGPLIDELARGYRAGRDHRLFVLIGRRTFSSAVLNAIDLVQEAGAVLIGEPSGGRPNHYGEVKSLELPYTGLQVSYSTKYFDHYDAGGGALEPAVSAPPDFEAFMDGRDPALEAVTELTRR